MKPTLFNRRKKTFNQLTISEKRMAIARDVIARIMTNQFKAIKGWVWNIGKKKYAELSPVKPLHEFVLEKEKCGVCAKGGLFMSCVGFTNGFIMDDINDRQSTIEGDEEKQLKSLTKIFSPYQLGLIETAYEKSAYGWNPLLKEGDKEKCISFGKKFKTNNQRLISICKNIIKNKGIFIPY